MLWVRAAVDADSPSIWKILEPIIRAGDTYALPRELTRSDALAYWYSNHHDVFVADESGEVIGTYYLRANQSG